MEEQPGFVNIIRSKNRLYPCDKCRYRFVLHNPKCPIQNGMHSLQQRWRALLPSIRSGQDLPYAEIIGECNEFTK